MKILHIVHQYAPDFVGGTELYTAKLAAEQVKRGHRVAVFVPSPQPAKQGEAILSHTVESGVTIYRVSVGARSGGRIFWDTLSQPKPILDSFETVLVDFSPDVIHIQHLMGLPASVVQQINNAAIPYIVTLHDYWYGCANAQLLTNYDGTVCAGPNRLFTNCGRCAFARAGAGDRPLLAGAFSPLMGWRQARLRAVLAQARTVIAPTAFVRQVYEEIGFSTANFVHVPHGIELPEELIAVAKEAAPQRRAERPERLSVVYVGGIAPQKGLHTLIEAFNQLPHDASLTIYGDLTKFPDYVSHLRDLIAHSGIELGGRLPHERIWGEMATADWVAMPTHWYEASPLTIDEVFAVGSPLIASNLGAMTEKIRHQTDGWLVPPNDVVAWVEALQLFYTDRGLSGRLRKNIGPVFTLEEHVERVQALY